MRMLHQTQLLLPVVGARPPPKGFVDHSHHLRRLPPADYGYVLDSAAWTIISGNMLKVLPLTALTQDEVIELLHGFRVDLISDMPLQFEPHNSPAPEFIGRSLWNVSTTGCAAVQVESPIKVAELILSRDLWLTRARWFVFIGGTLIALWCNHLEMMAAVRGLLARPPGSVDDVPLEPDVGAPQ
jgi:hypothetical protein